MSGQPQVFASVPHDRLAPKDLYRQLDWIRDEWSCDEYEFSRKLRRLRQTWRRLPAPFYQRGLPLLDELGRYRLVNDPPYRSALMVLGQIVSEWGRGKRTA